jgi:phosphate-selective porin
MEGGKKHELDARSHTIREWEAGIEWQPVKQFELVAMYTISSRRSEDHILKENHQDGSLLRLQVQINF